MRLTVQILRPEEAAGRNGTAESLTAEFASKVDNEGSFRRKGRFTVYKSVDDKIGLVLVHEWLRIIARHTCRLRPLLNTGRVRHNRNAS